MAGGRLGESSGGAASHRIMNASKANIVRPACIFGICGFLVGFVCGGAVVELWATPLGRLLIAPTSADFVWARFRFGAGFAFLAATAPLAAVLFPPGAATHRRSLYYLAVSITLCVVALLLVRSAYAQHAWDANYTTFFATFPTVAQFPLFLSPALSAAFTLAVAVVLRVSNSYGAFQRFLSRHANSSRYDY